MATASTTSLIGSRARQSHDGVQSQSHSNSHSPSAGSNVPSLRDEELVGGYIREAQGLLRRVNRISPLIEFLCLLYFEIDRFDTASIGASMDLQLDGHKVIMREDKPESAYLRHKVDSRVKRYTWKLRFNRLAFAHYWTTTIGIYKCRRASAKSPRTEGIFTIDGAYPYDSAGTNNVAYGFAANKGALLDVESGSGGDNDNSTRYGKRCGTGDLVEMTLDFESLELHFAINGEAYGCAFTVEDTEYRAAVNLCHKGDSIQIIRQ